LPTPYKVAAANASVLLARKMEMIKKVKKIDEEIIRSQFNKKNKAGLLKPTLLSIAAVYSFLQPLFCNTLFNPSIILVKLTVFILR
jgi:hypothetical protein